MPDTRVVHCKHEKYDVYIGRPSKWGNPFLLAAETDRALIVAQYEEWVLGQPDLVTAIKRELRGKVLGCWCAPKACHGDILARIANEVATHG